MSESLDNWVAAVLSTHTPRAASAYPHRLWPRLRLFLPGRLCDFDQLVGGWS